jgi:fatty-acyl-CoA synthase
MLLLNLVTGCFRTRKFISHLPDGTRHQYNFRDLYQRAKKLAHALVHQLNIKPGDKVATFAWNHYQHLELYYAIPGVGAVCHPLNIRLSGEQVEYIVNHAEDKVIFIDATLVPFFEKIAPLTPMVQRFVLLNAPEDSLQIWWGRYTTRNSSQMPAIIWSGCQWMKTTHAQCVIQVVPQVRPRSGV